MDKKRMFSNGAKLDIFVLESKVCVKPATSVGSLLTTDGQNNPAAWLTDRFACEKSPSRYLRALSAQASVQSLMPAGSDHCNHRPAETNTANPKHAGVQYYTALSAGDCDTFA